ncbi:MULTISPECIES: elongation factor G [unclassified Microcystis]|jgi:elongation factor G|uniref:Elongation factor G n=1 Tax=Microcystis flos-aquae Mf_QC_C_20070823_S10D TaxID=2486236 RepID=A0A552L4X5_9CHRO|nr:MULTISPECIES: elongation factor G [unclassified Microcystis]MCA2818090.1 elongation factor G [Microcystis sp. M085S1]MCA2856006.1 elongation factor G [Microcystis sp. M065S1]TRT79110.1 MAG: elongation factor G [Microcystis flos-aquae Ma_QC_C_20070823_S18]TRT97752.1 MAG: elongation factor G [Microcystis flos-aquae Ma_QC_C_20070823_S18D]TRV15285.1 MAG: elongation factor G [Microcystis flos-aquae Mf_QC_C_20070823_S10D]TRV21629.1 MAG: elongation factor G [Microcystis flos-aquae Mf_QC_C_2007082
MNQSIGANTRNVALVGPYSSGKTSLLESLLFVTGAITRKGKISDRNTVGDSSTQARDRQMSVEVSVAHSQYQDLNFTFLDCPGSIEFASETYNALVGAGAAIIVCEPVVDRVLTLAPLLKFLDDWEIPHLIFINKMDRCNSHFNEVLQALKSVSSRPLVPQQYPIRQNNETIGFIDLINEQAYHYHPNSPADPVPLPDHLKEEEQSARQEMLETIAEFDDHLLEELLEDINPSREEILQDLKQELGADQIVPVFFGMAERDYGVRHLLTALVEEAPAPTITANRRGLDPSADGDAVVQILKTYFTPQGGRLSLGRIWQGTLNDGMALNGVRIGGIYRLMGQQQQPLQQAQAGEIVALGRLEGIATGDVVSSGSQKPDLPKGLQLKPVFALAIAAVNRKDEVKLSSALTKLIEEDPSLYWEQHGDTKEVILWGQGEIHLQVALDRLARKYNLPMTTHLPQVPYKETIKTSTKSHGRYKHQTGGHGAFGDVYLDIKPLARGEGFHFHESIVGGVVPKQYIPGVETGVREYLGHGPLGFPVVDIDVTLTDGSYHSVDSSEQAFKQAARLAMTEGLPKCHPVLLEPILSVTVLAPSEYTAKVLQLISGKRGQIQGFEASEEWKGWDQITTYLPQAEMQDFIVELRSLTMGVGFFQWDEDHLQEVPDKLRDAVLAMQGNGNK